MIWGMIRHGEAIRKVPGEILGHISDHGLTAEALTSDLRGFLSRLAPNSRPREIWTAPAGRACHTALLIAERTGIPIRGRPWLCDRNYGDLVGTSEVYPKGIKTFDERLFHPVPNGELMSSVIERIDSRIKSEDFEGVLIVSHALILQVFYARIMGISFESVYTYDRIEEGCYWRPEWGDTGPGNFGREVTQ